MPAVDPADQQAARVIESSLRETVARRERPPVELDWFLALPKRVRRSGKLVEAALADAQVLLEHVRTAWTKAASGEREREERLARAKAQPRDLECLRAPDPAAWNGLGRRKKRCRAFEVVGRAYNTRHRASAAAPEPQSPFVDLHLLHPASCYVPKRPSTPPGLRDAVRNIPGLVEVARGPADATQYGFPTPCSPSPLPSPLPPRVIRRAPSPRPPPQPILAYEGETIIDGEPVDCRLAYLMAMGRWQACRSAVPPTLRQCAQHLLDTEKMQPGVLDALLDIFFPHGLDDWSLARPKLVYLQDFVLGWYTLAP
ncbi:hypothetical protein FRC08_018252 [Ceratobasidium sp. 394]|nr:hypothetical protein FRC08_018252 [Ceratobasidium sp. 394]KAG9080047.1 hypothetical protein FS749_008150 [Ceratobasidium sp. UAMH 11750]